MTLSIPLVLASRSPRRRKLLEQLGFSFTVEASPADEAHPADIDDARALVQHLAEQKAAPVAARYPDALVLAADTVVALDGDLLEKPADAAEARHMLERLSGRRHTVHTGFALRHAATERQVTEAAATRVTFGALRADEIDAYVATGAPLDKAGAYGIQDDLGALFVEGIEGDYHAVVGLPLRRLFLALRTHFGDALQL